MGGQGGPDSLPAPSNERGLLMTDRTELTAAILRPDWKFLIGMSRGAVTFYCCIF